MSNLKDIAIVGGRGQMGQLYISRLKSHGYDPVSVDKPLDSAPLQDVLPQADLVLLSVPIEAFSSVLEQIGPYLGNQTILGDVASVKKIPMQKMLDAFHGPVVGTHPLFGPAPAVDDPLRVTICPGRDENAARLVFDLMQEIGFAPFMSTADEHDKSMAYVQGLNFITTVSYLSCMPNDENMAKFLTPSFKRRLASASKMITQDADLFSQLFDNNPFSGESVRTFRSFLNIAAGGDLDLLKEKALWWWQDISHDDDY